MNPILIYLIMNVLSLFDGMSCGQIAIKELGINVDKYFASEIDKHAISQTQTNFPNTIQLGEVTKVKAKDLPIIDLLIGGIPCQGFSFAGKQLNFNDPRSALFFEYVRILKEVREKNPNVKFLLENVRMKKEYERVISEVLGIRPVVINSALVSAQNRIRLYWSNIRTRREGLFGELYTDIPQPDDRKIFLKDILEPVVDEKYFISNITMERFLRCHPNFTPRINPDKTGTLSTINNAPTMAFDSGTTFVLAAMRGREAYLGSNNWREQRLEPRNDGKTNAITTVHKDNLILDKSGILQRPRCKNKDGVNVGVRLRRLTPTECARLQTIPDWYVWKCSETQIYKMLGNGWTVEVIKHIFSFLI